MMEAKPGGNAFVLSSVYIGATYPKMLSPEFTEPGQPLQKTDPKEGQLPEI